MKKRKKHIVKCPRDNKRCKKMWRRDYKTKKRFAVYFCSYCYISWTEVTRRGYDPSKEVPVKA